MRERSNSLAELLSLSSSSSQRSKRVLMWLYCCVISALSKSVVEVMAVASAASGRAGEGTAVGVLRWSGRVWGKERGGRNGGMDLGYWR